MLKLITCRIRGAELNKLRRELPNIKPIANLATLAPPAPFTSRSSVPSQPPTPPPDTY